MPILAFDTDFGEFLAGLFFYGLFFFIPIVFFALVVHLFFSVPFRRRERAHFFLDLLDTALSRNISIEQAIVSAAESRDRALGVRFYMVAAHIESGLKLSEALEKVPRFLPPQISGILGVGEKLGDLKKVLPACREMLRIPSPSTSSAVHYMAGLLLVFSPVAIWIVTVLNIWVVPQFKVLAEGLQFELWPVSELFFRMVPIIVYVEASLLLLLFLAALVYVGGPGLVRWFRFDDLPLVDWLAWHIPWKRKRLQRAFSAMLAVLLDGGVPEAEAVRLAGESTKNVVCAYRAMRVIAAMSQGTPMEQAIQRFDDTDEFQWRLSNATHARGGFLSALKGWHESLEAKAFQQEEATAHVVTSGLVIVNGIVVALIAVAMFGALISIINGELSW